LTNRSSRIEKGDLPIRGYKKTEENGLAGGGGNKLLELTDLQRGGRICPGHWHSTQLAAREKVKKRNSKFHLKRGKGWGKTANTGKRRSMLQ